MLLCWAMEHQQPTLALQLAHCLYSALCRSREPSLLALVMDRLCDLGDSLCLPALQAIKQSLKRYHQNFWVSKPLSEEILLFQLSSELKAYSSLQQGRAVRVQALSFSLQAVNPVEDKEDLMLCRKWAHNKRELYQLVREATRERANTRACIAIMFESHSREANGAGHS